MAKESISATIEDSTINAVKEISEKEDRSFSKMVDILLKLGIETFKKNKKSK